MTIEYFYRTETAIKSDRALGYTCWNDEHFTEGWYYWPCEPGCLPDSDPVGPFSSQVAAKIDATSQ